MKVEFSNYAQGRDTHTYYFIYRFGSSAPKCVTFMHDDYTITVHEDVYPGGSKSTDFDQKINFF